MSRRTRYPAPRTERAATSLHRKLRTIIRSSRVAQTSKSSLLKEGETIIENHYNSTVKDVEKWSRGKKLATKLRDNKSLQEDLEEGLEWWRDYVDELWLHK